MKTKQVKRQMSWTLSFLLVSFILTIFATPAASQSDTTNGVMEDQVVVRFTSETIAQSVLDTMSNAFVIDRLSSSPTFLLGYCCGWIDPYAESQNLAGQHGVIYAHPNFVFDSLNSVQGSYPFPDDPGGDNKYHGQPAADMLKLDMVHPATTGQGVRIGVIDGGINFNHPLFDTMSFGGFDFVDDDSLAFDEPGGLASGHGTFVAGIVHLVAPGAELVPYRVMNAFGHGDGFALARAIERAVLDSCRLINVSLVLTDRHRAVRDAIEYAESQNIAVVVAAGNASTGDNVYPAAENATIAVAAVDSTYVLADYSNYGTYINVCAPGDSLYSAYLDSTYAWWSGTSFAAPCVAGQLALLTEIYPLITIGDYMTIIADDCIDLDQYNPGYEGLMGDGLINTYQAVLSAGVMAIRDNSIPANPAITVTLTPDGLEHTAWVNQCWDIVEIVRLESSNAPAVYYVEILDGDNPFVSLQKFTTLRFAKGLTNANVYLYIYPTKFNKAGTYKNTVAFYVAGAQHPVMFDVIVNILKSDPGASNKDPGVETPGLTNYPNPFNPSTTIYFSLERACDVDLTVYDVLGRKVTCLHSGGLPAGKHEFLWDGTNADRQHVSSGMYFYRLRMGEQTVNRKMMLIK